MSAQYSGQCGATYFSKKSLYISENIEGLKITSNLHNYWLEFNDLPRQISSPAKCYKALRIMCTSS